MTIEIGTVLWTKDSRDHRAEWRGETVVGETKQSWLVKRDPDRPYPPPTRVNKKTLLENCGQWGKEQWFTKEGMEDRIWLLKNRAPISHRIDHCTNVAVLKQILTLLEGS